jgi:hypothetical protein
MTTPTPQKNTKTYIHQFSIDKRNGKKKRATINEQNGTMEKATNIKGKRRSVVIIITSTPDGVALPERIGACHAACHAWDDGSVHRFPRR